MWKHLHRLIYSGVLQSAQFYLFMWLFWRTPSTLKIAKSSPPYKIFPRMQAMIRHLFWNRSRDCSVCTTSEDGVLRRTPAQLFQWTWFLFCLFGVEGVKRTAKSSLPQSNKTSPSQNVPELVKTSPKIGQNVPMVKNVGQNVPKMIFYSIFYEMLGIIWDVWMNLFWIKCFDPDSILLFQ